MRSLFFLGLAICTTHNSFAQTAKTELYDLVKKLSYDSTGYENVGDWAVGNPKKYPIAFNADRVEMSDDTSINFFRRGNANITVNGKAFSQGGQPVKWTIMLKGPRMGYGSYSLISSPSADLSPKPSIDSLFRDKKFAAKLIKECDKPGITGFKYYEVKIPRKDIAYLKLSWITINGNTAWRIDGYDSWSKAAAKLDCPR